MASKYLFENKKAQVKASVQFIIDQFLSGGYSAEHILGSYLDWKKKISPSKYPLVNLWNGVTAIEFLAGYSAYLSGTKRQNYRLVLESEFGIDHGFVSDRFFQPVTSSVRILIINPHPQFVQSLKEKTAQITVVYTDDQYAELMQTQKKKGNVSFSLLRQLPSKQYHRVLLFGQSLSTQQLVLMLEQIKPALVDKKDTIIYMQIPSKHLDSQHNRSMLREHFRKNYCLNQAIMLDPKAANGHDKSKLLLIVQNSAPSPTADVVLQKMELIEDKGTQYLSGNETRRLSYSAFLSGTKTMRATYDTLGRDTSHECRRERKVLFRYSKEIGHVWVSSMPQNSDVIRPKYTVCDTPTTDQLRRNKNASGKRLLDYHQGPRMSSREEAMKYALEYLCERTDVSKLVGDIIYREYYSKPISLKSLWFIYRNEIMNLRNYDAVICEQLFRRPYNCDCQLDNLIVGVSSYAEILDAVKQHWEDNARISGAEGILAQISLLWDVGIKKMHNTNNPISEHHNTKPGISTKQKQRNALVIGSHSEHSTNTLLSHLINNTELSPLHVGFWIQYFLPVIAGDVCALKWKDFKKVSGQEFYKLIVDKRFGKTGKSAIPIASQLLARDLPVVRTLEEILKKHKSNVRKQLLAQGRTDISIEECPIISSPKDPTEPIAVKMLNAFVRKTLATLELPSQMLAVPTGGDYEMTDMNSKTRGFLQSNFKHCMIEHSGMTGDEIAYMIGRTPLTVLAKYYLDRNHKNSLKTLWLKMSKWEAVISIDGQACKTFIEDLRNDSVIVFPKSNTLLEATISLLNPSQLQ